MSEPQKYNFEYNPPPNLNCEVLGEQKFREAPLLEDNQSEDIIHNFNQSETSIQNFQNGGETDKQESYVPVLTVKKEEAVFTKSKGDLKLQKVTVTEKFSASGSMSVQVANPLYATVHGDVIEGPQPLRISKVEDESDEDVKLRSKIPKLRHEAEKLIERNRKSIDVRESEVPSNQQRRSSIPRLKRTKVPSTSNESKEPIIDNNLQIKDIKKEENTEEIVNNENKTETDEETLPPDDEFDKIYDEMIQSAEENLIDTKVRDTVKVENTVKLEHKFEDLIHDYAENKLEPIDVKEIRSRIPLVKQKSLPEEEMVKFIPRRLSLKHIPLDDNRNKRSVKADRIDELKKPIDKLSNEHKPESRLPKIESKNNDKETKKEKLIIENATKGVDKEVPKTATASKTTIKSNANVTQSNIPRRNSQTKNVKNIDPTVKESIKIATPNLKETHQTKTIEKVKDQSKRVEQVSKNIQDNNNNMTPADGPQEEKIKEELPVVKNKIVDSSLHNDKYKSSSFRNKNVPLLRGVSAGEKRETVNKSHEKERGKTTARNDLMNRIKSYDEDVVPVKKEVTKDDFQKKPVVSKYAQFSKSKDKNTEKKVISSRVESLASTTRPEESKNENNKFENVTKEITKTSKEDINKINNEKAGLSKKICRGSSEKVKLLRSESVPVETKNIVSKIRHLTPPNSPHNEKEERNDDTIEERPFINMTENETDDFEAAFGKVLDNNELKRAIKINQERETVTFDNKCPEPIDNIHVSLTTNTNIENNSFAEDLIEKYDYLYNKNPHIDIKSYERQEILELGTPLDKISSKIDPFEAINKDLYKVGTKIEHTEDDIEIRGKVNRIINKLVSVDESNDLVKKDVIDIPIKKNVSSRIAMFERQSQDSAPKFSRKPKKEEQIEQSRNISKPRIIDEVLKPLQPLSSGPTSNNDDIDIATSHDGITAGLHRLQEVKNVNELSEDAQDTKIGSAFIEDIAQDSYEEYYAEVAQVINLEDTIKSTANEQMVDDNNDNNTVLDRNFNQNIIGESIVLSENAKLVESNTNNIDTLENILTGPEIINIEETKVTAEILLPKDERTKQINENRVFVARTNEIPRLEDRLRGLKSRKQDTNLTKAKSMAELNLVKGQGKVHQVLERMVSTDGSFEKKNKIAIRDRPRKKTVSEKILLFERKLVDPKAAEVVPAKSASTTSSTPPQMTPEDLSCRVEELSTAKNYGRVEVETMTLHNGVKMPVLALGTALIDPGLLPHVISAAIEMGFRAIDTGYIYCNEKVIGEAIQAKIHDGTVKREELFIINKLWSTFHRRDLVETACRASLETMGLTYFDLYLIHNPMSFKEGPDPIPKIANVIQYSEHDYLDAWFGMEDLITKSLAKSIGLSNFNSEQVARVVEKGKIKPAVNQVECHPYLNQLRLEQFCADRNIKLMCFGTLGSKGTPQEYKNSTAAVIDDPLVKVMAAGLNITAAQLLIRYQLESGRAVVVKSSRAAHLWDVLQALKTRLSIAEVDALNALNRNKRTFVFKGMGDTHKNYPFKIQF